MKRRLFLTLALGLALQSATVHAQGAAEPAEGGGGTTGGSGSLKVVEVGPAAAVASFGNLWLGYRRADDAGNAESSAKALADIQWFRIERNIRSLTNTGTGSSRSSHSAELGA